MKAVVRSLLIVLAVAAAGASSARAAEPQAHPIFVRADSGRTGSWTGYTSTIYVGQKPTYAVWPGGYLADGTFVQSGLIVQGHDDLYAFAWATKDVSTGAAGQVPLAFVKVTPRTGTWITFELAQLNGRWTFRYRDATGWHVQGTFLDRSRIVAFQVVNEYWAVGPEPFTTQIVKDVRVRTGTVWALPPAMAATSQDEECGHDSVTSPYPGKIVFRSVEGTCVASRDLWR